MNVNFGGNNGTVTGTTTASYVVAVTITGNGGLTGKTIIQLSNLSGATTTMYYKIDGYYSTHPSCVATAIKAETSIANATPVVNTDADKPFAKVVVSVVDNSGHCNYQIDYMVY
jgi:hypothetical protein